MSDSYELDKRKATAKAPPAQPPDLGQDPASGYSFFVNEPGNSQYNYGLDVSLSAPVSIPGYTAYTPTPAPPPAPTATSTSSSSGSSGAAPAPSSSYSPSASASASSSSSYSASSGYSPSSTSFNPDLDYAPVYSAAAAEMAQEHQRDDIQIDSDRPSVFTPAMAEAFFAKPETIAQNATFGQSATINQGAKVFENATFGLETSVAQTAASIEHAELIQDAAPIENTVPVQNAAPVLSAFTVQNAAPIENIAPVQNITPIQNVQPVQDAASKQSAFVSQDANTLRAWGVVKPDPPPAQDASYHAGLSKKQIDEIDSEIWPTDEPNRKQSQAAKKGTPVPLHLGTDKRFASLVLAPELAATVDRIYTLVDLDFSGYVDFSEMSSVLNSEHLSDSEKSFVRMIYAVGCKVLAERPAVSQSTVPVLTQDDFRRAFAYQCANTLGADAKSKGILASSNKGANSAERFTEIKPTLYADNDYPQMSLQAAAVRLGTMGDAFFAAGVSSLAEARPRALLRILSENLDHSFTVAFPGAHGNTLDVMPPRPEEILRYGLVAKYGFWFPLLEKAYGIHLAQKHRLANKLAEPRNEGFARVSQVIETLTAAFTGTLVTADCTPQDLLLQLSDLIARKRIVIAVSSDFVPETSSFAGTAPTANKPYPLTGFDRQRGHIFLSSVYGHDTHHEEEPLRFTTEQFLQYFKVIYFEQEVAPAVQASNLMRSTQKQSSNPWKKA